MKHLVVMAAGTGGHVMPGLAVAAEMQQRGWSVSWLGTTTGMENRLVPKAGLALDRVAFAGMRGKGLLGNLRGAMQMLAAFASCAKLLRQRRADAVLGMGGYVCFPGGWMAWLQRRPLLLVNADASLLLSNKALKLPAKKIAFGFPGEAAEAMGKKAVVTGNLVRAAIEALAAPADRFAAMERRPFLYPRRKVSAGHSHRSQSDAQTAARNLFAGLSSPKLRAVPRHARSRYRDRWAGEKTWR